jgi:hypothetical protein
MDSLILQEDKRSSSSHAHCPLHSFLKSLADPHLPQFVVRRRHYDVDWKETLVVVGDLGITHGRIVMAALQEWMQTYPEIVSFVDDVNGTYPLHVACQLSTLGNDTEAAILQDDDAPSCISLFYEHTKSWQAFQYQLVQCLVRGYPIALTAFNHNEEPPVLVAACHGAGLNTIYFLLRESPSCLVRHSR